MIVINEKYQGEIDQSAIKNLQITSWVLFCILCLNFPSIFKNDGNSLHARIKSEFFHRKSSTVVGKLAYSFLMCKKLM